MSADIRVSRPCPERAAASGLLNETALLEMVAAVQVRGGASLAAGRFPLVYGGDCAVLLAAVPALRTVVGEAGLVFLDGHEDATSMEASLSGEAANMEVALLLGLMPAPARPAGARIRCRSRRGTRLDLAGAAAHRRSVAAGSPVRLPAVAGTGGRHAGAT